MDLLNKFKKIRQILFRPINENLWKRNLIILAIAQFIAMVGMNGLVPFLPLFVLELGIKDPVQAKFWSSMVFAGPYFLSIFAVPVWGMLGDRYGQKKMVIRAIFGLALAVFLMGFSINVYQLFALRIFQGASSGFIAAALAFVSKNTPKNRNGYAIGILQSASSAGIIIGPFFGGILSDASGVRSVFIIVAILCVISGILIIGCVKEQRVEVTSTQSKVLDNLKTVIHNGEMSKIILLIILSQLAILLSNPIFPYYVARLGAPQSILSTITGLLVATVGIFSIIFAPYWGRKNDTTAYSKIFSPAVFVAGLASLLHVISNHYLWLFPIRATVGVFFAAIAPSLYSALSYRADESNKGGIMGIASSANLLGALLSYLSCSVIVSHLDMVWTFVASGVILISLSIWAKVR
ncbi:MAG: MFS transporter [Ignavibacteria bacterium]|nr:MFS transporter [Ignavibacteria bacterium]